MSYLRTLVMVGVCVFCAMAFVQPVFAQGASSGPEIIEARRLMRAHFDEHRARIKEHIARMEERLCERAAHLEERYGMRMPRMCRGGDELEEHPTVALYVTPATIPTGGTATLAWTSEHADACVASGGWSGPRATSGNEGVSPTATTTYTLSCTNGAGTATDSVAVNVTGSVPTAPLPLVVLTAEPTQVIANSTSTLFWTATHASSCTASHGWSGPRATSGSEVVTIAATTTYVLACTNPGGTATASVEVAVIPPTPTVSTGKVVVSEVLFDPASASQGGDTYNEWVEIHNGMNVPIDLHGWTMHDTVLGTATDTLATTTLVLPPGGYLIVTRSTTTDTFWAPYPQGTLVVYLGEPLGSGGLSNAGEAVVLRDAAGAMVDGVSWGTNTSVLDPSVSLVGFAEGMSIARVPVSADIDTAADWTLLATPTPGA